jgi:hypothetical protein
MVKELYGIVEINDHPSHPPIGSDEFDTWVKKEFCRVQKMVIDLNYTNLKKSLPNLSKPKCNLDPSDPSFDIVETYNAVTNWITETLKTKKHKVKSNEKDKRERQRSRSVPNTECRRCSALFYHSMLFGDICLYFPYCSAVCEDSSYTKRMEEKAKGIIQYVRNGQFYTL